MSSKRISFRVFLRGALDGFLYFFSFFVQSSLLFFVRSFPFSFEKDVIWRDRPRLWLRQYTKV